MDKFVWKAQAVIVRVLMLLLLVVVALSTVHLGVLIAEEIWKPPRFLIVVPALLELFGYFLLVLIGVELLETLRSYAHESTSRLRVVLEVALIAAARKVITLEPNTTSGVTLFGIAALILALGIAFYLQGHGVANTGASAGSSR